MESQGWGLGGDFLVGYSGLILVSLMSGVELLNQKVRFLDFAGQLVHDGVLKQNFDQTEVEVDASDAGVKLDIAFTIGDEEGELGAQIGLLDVIQSVPVVFKP